MKKVTLKDAIETLKMQRIAKIITESEYHARVKLLEDAAEDLEKAMGKDLAGAVADLKTLAKDPEFKDLATKGKEDGNPNDEAVNFTNTPVPATDMYPTQAEIGFSNSLDDIVNDKWGAIDSAFSNPVKMPSPEGKIPVLCAEIGGKIAILDGHHRWSLCFMINPDAQMSCDIMEAPAGMGAEEALKAMQLGIAAKAGKVVTEPLKGKDLMATSTEEVMKYVRENIGRKEIQKFAKYAPEIFKQSGLPRSNKDADDPKYRDAVAKHIGRAHKLILAMKGIYPRIIMPQAGRSGDKTTQNQVNTAFAAGDINFKEPFKTESISKRLDAMLKETVTKTSKLIK